MLLGLVDIQNVRTFGLHSYKCLATRLAGGVPQCLMQNVFTLLSNPLIGKQGSRLLPNCNAPCFLYCLVGSGGIFNTQVQKPRSFDTVE